jgi:hypothetical protein
LQTIVDYERFNPATARAFDGGACGLGCADLETPECSCSAMTAYWSATPLADDPTHAFVVTFNLGLIGDVRKREENAVRAVRAIRQRADVGAPDASAPGGSRDSHN